MCLAVPAKIISVSNNNLAKADFGGVYREVNLSLVDAKKGDWIIVHAGYAIQKLDEKEAKRTLRMFEEILS